MKSSDFDYDLPKVFIAQEAVHPKSYSRLLVLGKDHMEIKRFYNIKDYLSKDDVLVVNTSKVVYAELVGKKESGSRAIVILLGKEGKYHRARVYTRNAKKGTRLIFQGGLKAEITSFHDDESLLLFSGNDSKIKKMAHLPTPPYIKQDLREDSDYQTVYSREEGSIAAPTAGLHFTKNLLSQIRSMGVSVAEVCLHVGLGTFQPIRSEDVLAHKMESEYFTITKENADIINRRKGRLFIVGTTTLRSLESAADKDGILHPVSKKTDLFIYPGYKFRIKPYGFITNFHLPKSTLILLVSALVGRKKILDAYEFAKKNNFRFYSLGDAMLILPE